MPSGIYGAEEARDAAERDPLVRRHYATIRLDQLTPAVLTTDERGYVSYRKGEQIYWTARPVAIAAGESVLSDGTMRIRSRCGNRISATPQQPVEITDAPLAELDKPLFPAQPDDKAGIQGDSAKGGLSNRETNDTAVANPAVATSTVTPVEKDEALFAVFPVPPGSSVSPIGILKPTPQPITLPPAGPPPGPTTNPPVYRDPTSTPGEVRPRPPFPGSPLNPPGNTLLPPRDEPPIPPPGNPRVTPPAVPPFNPAPPPGPPSDNPPPPPPGSSTDDPPSPPSSPPTPPPPPPTTTIPEGNTVVLLGLGFVTIAAFGHRRS